MASGRTMRARSVGGEGRALGSRRLARLPETLRRVWKALSARTPPRPTREVAARCAGPTGGKGRWGSDGRRATGEYLEWWLENCLSHSVRPRTYGRLRRLVGTSFQRWEPRRVGSLPRSNSGRTANKTACVSVCVSIRRPSHHRVQNQVIGVRISRRGPRLLGSACDAWGFETRINQIWIIPVNLARPNNPQ